MGTLFRRWRWALAIAALLIAGLAYALWPDATPVDLGKITRGPMTVGVTDDGVTRAEEFYVVSAPVTGYLSRIELEPGDVVAKGAFVTRMSGRPSTPLDARSRDELRSALTSARAAQANAATALAQARKDLARAEELARRGFLPRAQLEAARTRVASGQAAVAQARGEVSRIAASLAQPDVTKSAPGVVVHAPASGSVLSVLTESEGVIAEGTPLLTVGDPRRIEAVVDLLSRDAVKVRPGYRVEITQWGGDRPIRGRVLRVEPFGKLRISALGVEEQRVNVIIGFDPAEAGAIAQLGHGFQIDATVILWDRKDAVRVPIGALFRRPESDDSGASADGGQGTGKQWRVFVADKGRARERAVRVGHVNDEYGEVLSGLNAGEAVVLNPGNDLADGERITAR